MNTSALIIKKIPPGPPIPPLSENHEENQAKTAGGISTNGGTIPPVNKIPPVQNTEKSRSIFGDWSHWRYWRLFGYR
jgi:hypothetical protein